MLSDPGGPRNWRQVGIYAVKIFFFALANKITVVTLGCDVGIAEGSEDMAAFHGLDDDGSVMSIKVALRKGRMAEVWMIWKDEVGYN